MNKTLFILLMITSAVFSQSKINNYKYIIVPNKFDFVKSNDQYKTSSLTKFLFNKYGFTAFLINENFPSDLGKNRCLALVATVKDDSSMFTTKSIIELKDCHNNIVFSSNIGKSKSKEYKKAYNETIRKAFKSIQLLNYKYSPLKPVNLTTDVKNSIVIPNIKVRKNELINSTIVKNSVNSLYAQSTVTGFQLVDTKPEVIFKILRTNVKDVFIIKDKNGLLYKNNDIWIVEYYKEGIKITENYKIKF